MHAVMGFELACLVPPCESSDEDLFRESPCMEDDKTDVVVWFVCKSGSDDKATFEGEVGLTVGEFVDGVWLTVGKVTGIAFDTGKLGSWDKRIPTVVVDGDELVGNCSCCPTIQVIAVLVVESLRGRPLLRFGETGGLCSGLVFWVTGIFCCGKSGPLCGILGGRPLLRFSGTGLFTFESLGAGQFAALSLSELAFCFLGDKADLHPNPRPLPTNCSPNCAAIRDSISSCRRTGRFRRTGMSGEWCVGEYGGWPFPGLDCDEEET